MHVKSDMSIIRGPFSRLLHPGILELLVLSVDDGDYDNQNDDVGNDDIDDPDDDDDGDNNY